MTNVTNGPLISRNRNRWLAYALTILVALMLGAAYAAVPLYRLFCQATGYGGTTERASANPKGIIDRPMTVSFDSNITAGVPWTVTPASPVTAKVGSIETIDFIATNNADHPVTGQAGFNVSPEGVGAYFDKIQCFCFTQQTLQAHQTVHMPVVFFVDPDIAKDHDLDTIRNITLSYTFYAVDKQGKLSMADVAHARPNHDYHLVNPSPWPAVGSVSAFVLAVGAILFMRHVTPWIMVIGFIGVLYTMYSWWSDVIHESLEGDHTRVVAISHRYGMMLFIASEVMFFVAWFWAYFDGFFRHDDPLQFARAAATGATWPPIGVEAFNPWHLPLFNTLLLLCSGTTVTWAHHALLENDRKGLKFGLVLTILLGMCFTLVQGIEYSHAGFAYSGNIYGATFFMATGFHGFHVIVGTIFLIVCLARAQMGQFTPTKHLGFEFAAWYWHFVDVVWLFLFASIYVWGSWGVALPPG